MEPQFPPLEWWDPRIDRRVIQGVRTIYTATQLDTGPLWESESILGSQSAYRHDPVIYILAALTQAAHKKLAEQTRQVQQEQALQMQHGLLQQVSPTQGSFARSYQLPDVEGQESLAHSNDQPASESAAHPPVQPVADSSAGLPDVGQSHADQHQAANALPAACQAEMTLSSLMLTDECVTDGTGLSSHPDPGMRAKHQAKPCRRAQASSQRPAARPSSAGRVHFSIGEPALPHVEKMGGGPIPMQLSCSQSQACRPVEPSADRPSQALPSHRGDIHSEQGPGDAQKAHELQSQQDASGAAAQIAPIKGKSKSKPPLHGQAGQSKRVSRSSCGIDAQLKLDRLKESQRAMIQSKKLSFGCNDYLYHFIDASKRALSKATHLDMDEKAELLLTMLDKDVKARLIGREALYHPKSPKQVYIMLKVEFPPKYEQLLWNLRAMSMHDGEKATDFVARAQQFHVDAQVPLPTVHAEVVPVYMRATPAFVQHCFQHIRMKKIAAGENGNEFANSDVQFDWSSLKDLARNFDDECQMEAHML